MDDYEIDYAEIEAHQQAEARRRAMTDLHVVGRKIFGKAWDSVRGECIATATDNRKWSAKECTTDELRAATNLLINGQRTPAYMYMSDEAAGISSYHTYG